MIITIDNIDYNVQQVPEIEGLYYIDNVVTNADDIIGKLDASTWIPLSQSANSRMVQHYGYKYNYNTYSIKEKADDIPQYIEAIQSTLTQLCNKLNITDETYKFNQCIVNNYNPGQGISRHIDVTKYGHTIGCYTLGSGATMKFTRDGVSIPLYVRPNSLYIMSGPSRYKWYHEMISAKYDKIDDVNVPRTRRISVTFRNVPLTN